MGRSQGRKVTVAFLIISSILLSLLIGICHTGGIAGLTSPPKYVFLFIGDGFSYPQINLTKYYLESIGSKYKLVFDEFDECASAYTHCEDSQVTDSAAAASAIASGNKIPFGYLNLNSGENQQYETIAEKLKNQKNYKIGIVTSQYLNHATPAGFYSHQNSRYNFYEIGLEAVNSDFDFFAGGEFLYKTGSDGTKENLNSLFEKNDYSIANSLENIDKDAKTVLINPVLASDGTVPFCIDNINMKKNSPTVASLTKLGIETLYNKDGFFMMVEGGKIDTAAHANDARTVIEEVIDFNNAIKAALEFYNKHKKDTLIIITGDHETGGLSVGYTGIYYGIDLKYLSNQTISYYEFAKNAAKYRSENASFKAVMQDIENCFGIYVKRADDNKIPQLALTQSELDRLRSAYEITMTYPEERVKDSNYYILYDSYDPLTTEAIRILNQKCGVSWSTFYHTALSTPVMVKGNKSNLFSGMIDNTDINKILCKITDVK